jgi:hypothetical protein
MATDLSVVVSWRWLTGSRPGLNLPACLGHGFVLGLAFGHGFSKTLTLSLQARIAALPGCMAFFP